MTQPQLPAKLPLAWLVQAERSQKSDSNAVLQAAVNTLTAPDAVHGERAVYTPEPGQQQLPPLNQRVAVHALPVAVEAAEAWAKHVNLAAAKDLGNANPATWVDVRDPENPERILVERASAAMLLNLDAHLVKLRAFLEKLPTLPATDEWVKEGPDGVWESAPIHTRETAEVQDFTVGYEATERHPADVKYFPREVLLGVWETTRFSSALPPEHLRLMLKRVDNLLGAIRHAVFTANTVEVDQCDLGSALVRYIVR